MNWQNGFRILFIVLMLVVMGLSLAPLDHPDFAPNDKVNHLIAYATLMISGFLGFRKMWVMAVIVFLYGILIEVLQGMTTYRMLSWYDALANGTGVVLGCIVLILAQRIRERLYD